MNNIKLIAFFISLLPLSLNANLYDRGNGLIYDAVQNVTWMQNVNAGSSEVFFGGQSATTFAQNTTYAHYDDWRLPSTKGAYRGPYDGISSIEITELGSLVSRLNLEDFSFFDSDRGETRSFQNVDIDSQYWFGDRLATSYWAFKFNGYNGGNWMFAYNDSQENKVWLLRDGDSFSDRCSQDVDSDNDGIADVCDDDVDGDSILNEVDNCPNVSNINQDNLDGDASGDVCDSNIDGDFVQNQYDNCPSLSNNDQLNNDNDDFGNLCDDDDDNDGIDDAHDNCPFVSNIQQLDEDSDGLGDLCDFFLSDFDNDGLNDEYEVSSSSNNFDSDSDGVPDGIEVNLGTDPTKSNHTPFLQEVLITRGSDYLKIEALEVANDLMAVQLHGGQILLYQNINDTWEFSYVLTYQNGYPMDYNYGIGLSEDALLVRNTGLNRAYFFDRNSCTVAPITYCATPGWSLAHEIWSPLNNTSDPFYDPDYSSSYSYPRTFPNAVFLKDDVAVIYSRENKKLTYPITHYQDFGYIYVYKKINGIWQPQYKQAGRADWNSGWPQSNSYGSEVAISSNLIVLTDAGANGRVVTLRGDTPEYSKQTLSLGYSPGLELSGGDLIASYYDGRIGIYRDINNEWELEQTLQPSEAEYDSPTFSSSRHKVVASDEDIFQPNYLSAGSITHRHLSHYKKDDLSDIWTEKGVIFNHDDQKFGEFVQVDRDNLFISGFSSENGKPVIYVYNLNPQRDATISGDFTRSIQTGASTSGQVNAEDVNGLKDGSYFTISQAPSYGLALIHPSNGSWTYFSDATYVGEEYFTIAVTDDLGDTTEKLVTIIISAPDADDDGIPDPQDNCPNIANLDQLDIDADLIGDECDLDRDGDGIDNILDAFPVDPSESSDTDFDNVGDNSDNCIYEANMNQSDIDLDTLGDACDPDMDGDGILNLVELRFAGDQANPSDSEIVFSNIESYSKHAKKDSDYDGIDDLVEMYLGTNYDDPNDGDYAELSILELISDPGKAVPAMGGIGLLALGLSMLGLGAIRMRRQ